MHFKYVQYMVSQLMFKWARDFIPSLVPYLDEENQSQTTPKPRSATKNKPRSATKGNKRTTMEDDDDNLEFHAEDEDTDEPQQKKKQATPAKRTPKKARVLYKQVGEAGGVQILEEEEEEEEEEEDEQSAVATLSKKRKKPVKFTQEEKDAIKDGVETYGKGQWAAIRDSYRVLRHRDYAKSLRVSTCVVIHLVGARSNLFAPFTGLLPNNGEK